MTRNNFRENNDLCMKATIINERWYPCQFPVLAIFPHCMYFEDPSLCLLLTFCLPLSSLYFLQFLVILFPFWLTDLVSADNIHQEHKFYNEETLQLTVIIIKSFSCDKCDSFLTKLWPLVNAIQYRKRHPMNSIISIIRNPSNPCYHFRWMLPNPIYRFEIYHCRCSICVICIQSAQCDMALSQVVDIIGVYIWPCIGRIDCNEKLITVMILHVEIRLQTVEACSFLCLWLFTVGICWGLRRCSRVDIFLGVYIPPVWGGVGAWWWGFFSLAWVQPFFTKSTTFQPFRSLGLCTDFEKANSPVWI